MKYETAIPIGRGGIAEVLRAHDPELRRDVALKLLRRDDPSLAERLLREAQAQARVHHPNVCAVYETGTTEDGQPFIAMQLIDGVTLDLAAAELSVEQKVRILRDVAHAAQAAHAAGLIHRDLKPSNILVERQDDGFLKPWVVDFGIARQHDAPGLTLTGQVIGTPAYMPPEQARGRHDAMDRRSDVYALGAVFYELLTGQPPFSGQSTVDVLVQILQSDPVPVRRRAPQTPHDLETIAMKCLEKDPTRRYPSARALAEDLTRFLHGEPIAAHPVSWTYRVGKRIRKNKSLTVLVALLVLGVPAGILKYTLDLRDERQRAVAARHDAETLMDFMLEDLYRRLESLGRLDLLADVARQSLDYYDRERPAALDRRALRRRARALRNVGLVLESAGDLEGAFASIRRFQATASDLAEHDPSHPDYRYDLAESHQILAELLQERGDLEEALACLRLAKVLASDFTHHDPTSGRWHELLWHIHSDIGWLLLEDGDLDRAVAAMDEALSLARRQVERAPDAADWVLHLAESLGYKGLLQQEQGRFDAARASFEEAVELSEVWVLREPADVRWQFEMSLNYGRLAYIHQDHGDLTTAGRFFEASLAINERLVEKDPANTRWLRELAVDYSGLASVRRRQGCYEDARDNMVRSLDISRRLSGRDPSNPSMQNDLAWDLVQFGMVLNRLGDPPAAQTAWEEALGIITPIAESTGIAYYRDTQVLALLNLGRIDEARPIVEELHAEGWDDAEFVELCRRHGLLVPDSTG